MLELVWAAVAKLGVQPGGVVPPDPFQGRQFELFDGPPGPAAVDQLGFVETVDRLSQRVVVGVSDGSDRGSCAGIGQSFGVAQRDELAVRKVPSEAVITSTK